MFCGCVARFRQHLPDFFACVRTLHGDDREIAARRDGQSKTAFRIQMAEPRDVFLGRAGVHDDAVVVIGEVIDDQVIDHAAFRIQQARIQRLAGNGEFVDVVGDRVLEELARFVAGEIDDAHVRHVEHAGVGAHRVVFVDLRTVIDGHVPAAEIDHACVERKVSGVQGRVLKIRHGAGLGRARKQKKAMRRTRSGFRLSGCMNKAMQRAKPKPRSDPVHDPSVLGT